MVFLFVCLFEVPIVCIKRKEWCLCRQRYGGIHSEKRGPLIHILANITGEVVVCCLS
jgi:hypothetical protein